MSYVIAAPETLAAAATQVAGIGSMLHAANAAAARSTTGKLAAGADEVSAAIDGESFQVWTGNNGQNNVVSYVANTPMSSWNNFNVLNFVDNTETYESSMNSSWYLTSIQAGFEPWSGSVGAAVDSFSATIN